MSASSVPTHYLFRVMPPVDPVKAHVQELVEKELGSDFASFHQTPGKIDQTFSKAYSLWLQNVKCLEQDCHKEPQAYAWRSLVFMPLLNEGLRSDQPEDLCLLYAWANTCRYALGSNDHCHSDEFRKILERIGNKLNLHVGFDCKKVVDLLEHFSKRSKTIFAPGSNHSWRENPGLGQLFKFLCKSYCYNNSVTCQDLTELCRADIRDIDRNHSGSDFAYYLNYLIVYKGQQLLPKANLEEKTAFMDAFRELSQSHLIQQGNLHILLIPFFQDVTFANLQLLISRLLYSLPTYQSVEY
jgi:hypothetical protein